MLIWFAEFHAAVKNLPGEQVSNFKLKYRFFSTQVNQVEIFVFESESLHWAR